MKAILVSETKECILDTVPVPVPGEGQVLIKTICAPIHNLDIFKMRGTFSHFAGIPGYEGAGTVVKAGSGFKTQKLKGKNVCFFKDSNSSGTWSEYVLCEAADCCTINEEFGFIKASTMMLVPLTMIMIGKIIKKKRFTCIINTLASSALGKMIVRWCVYKEVTCINLVRSENKVREIIEIGGKYILNTDSKEFLSEFLTICEKLKPTACFDGLGGELGRLALKYLQPKGYSYIYSCLSEGNCLSLVGKDLFFSKKTLKGLWMPSWYKSLSERKKQKYFKKIQKRQQIFRSDNIIVSPVIEVLPFLNDYFQTLPASTTIFDFSELSKVSSSLFSPLPSPQSNQKISFTEESDDSSEDFSEIVESFKVPEVLTFLSKLPQTEPLNSESKYVMLNENSIYYGVVKDKKPEGFCYIYYQNGDIYQGHFELHQRRGKGRMVFRNTEWFEGSWKDNIPAGSGIYHFANGRVLQGNFLQFDVIGTGIEIMPNGESYEGGFLDKKRHGKGILVTKDWKYEGKFRCGEIFGYGIVKFVDGKEFVGEFSGNMGVGLLKYTDFSYFEGRIVDFLEDGEGEVVNKEGIRKKGLWEKGVLVHWIEDTDRLMEVEPRPEVIEAVSGTQVEIMNPEEMINSMVIK